MYPDIKPNPGQFFQVRVSENLDPFLNRPISVASYQRNHLLLVIKIVGRGTGFLSKKKEGEELLLFGPYGNKIEIPQAKSLLIAGGIGIAPLHFLAQRLHEKKIGFSLVYGEKATGDLILTEELKQLTKDVQFVSEQGKHKMTAVSAVKAINVNAFDVAYACGPRAMLLELQRLDLPIPVYAFCEDFLGCGCGLCLGCAIQYQGTYKRICEDGPVFELKDIEFNEGK